MLSFFALALVVICVTLLLTGRASPLVTFSLIPIIIASLAGFSPADIQRFSLAGIAQVTPIAVMFIFAILFFALMQERGLFDPLITAIVTRAGDHLIAVALATVAISALAHLDGSGASTFLICIPTLLPVYKRLEMSPHLLLLLVSASASVMNMLPWGGPLGRAATVVGADPTQLWYALIPVQGAALVLLFLGAYILGRRERARIRARRLVTPTRSHELEESALEEFSPRALKALSAVVVKPRAHPLYDRAPLERTLSVYPRLYDGALDGAPV